MPLAAPPATLAIILATINSNILAGTPLEVVTVRAFDLLIALITMCAVTDNLISSIFAHASYLHKERPTWWVHL
jgi:hypothetical protein